MNVTQPLVIFLRIILDSWVLLIDESTVLDRTLVSRYVIPHQNYYNFRTVVDRHPH